jgi:hypothetical protein
MGAALCRPACLHAKQQIDTPVGTPIPINLRRKNATPILEYNTIFTKKQTYF